MNLCYQDYNNRQLVLFMLLNLYYQVSNYN
nr:MAG TPA: hypothetical protein [Caudoviricetes sp.]